MTVLLTAISCASCGSTDLTEINRTATTLDGVIVHHCETCGAEWALAMHLALINKPTGVVQHGTHNALLWHRRNGIPVCDDCKAYRDRWHIRRRQLIGASK